MPLYLANEWRACRVDDILSTMMNRSREPRIIMRRSRVGFSSASLTLVCAGWLLILPLIQPAWGQTDWPMYAHDAGATRYSPLAQINTGNVSRLTQAWTYDTKPKPDAAPRDARTTPLVINGVMYFVTGFQSVVAVEPETGKQLWSFEHKRNARPAKGIAYWPGNKNSPPTLFFGTDDGFLIALNAKTGKPVPGFANEGELELREGMKR